ncbi:MAG: efflux RND transporter periplasmic adaptor subunit [Planctomycetaceae bacterium]
MNILCQKSAPHARAGKSRRGPLFVLAFLVVCCAAAGGAVYSLRGDAVVDVLTQRPIVGEFVNDIVERGELESSANVELRCEVASADGVRILEIVAEGSVVAKDDVIAQLDDSTLRKDLAAQKILVNNAEAALSKATNDHAAALIARKEYDLGTFVQEEQKLESELFVAEENSRRAANFLKYSTKLASRGYITDVQLESDRFSVEKFGKDLDAAKTKLNVIREYTKPKTLKKHDADIKTAEANANAEQAKLTIEIEKLKNLESQLEKCVIKAPSPGQVVFANQNRWRGDEFLVRKGNRVREKQVIVMLPDATKMQVHTKIGEARVDRVKPGMLAVVQVEALRGTELKGTVTTVNAYASDENWFSNVKEFDAVITLEAPPATLRPGMSSKVSIRVETQSNVLQVPIQTVVERGDKHYCVIRDSSGKLVLRELLIGSTNDKFIVVKEGLSATDDVVMNPRAHLAAVGLKDEDPSPKKKDQPETEAAPAKKPDQVSRGLMPNGSRFASAISCSYAPNARRIGAATVREWLFRTTCLRTSSCFDGFEQPKACFPFLSSPCSGSAIRAASDFPRYFNPVSSRTEGRAGARRQSVSRPSRSGVVVGRFFTNDDRSLTVAAQSFSSSPHRNEMTARGHS